MNLRNLLFASILTMFTVSVYAAPVDPARAINVAEQFMPAQQVASKPGKAQAPAQQQTPEIVYTHFMPKSGKPAIYVININGGFALVSADDVAHPVLGYNYGKPWPTDVDSLAPSVKGFLDDLAAQMEAASEHPQDAETAAEWQEPRHVPNRAPRRVKMDDNLPDSVGPLLTTTWDQGQYYNAMCPEDPNGPDGHALTGCVATAMAQIIKYWGDKQEIHTRGIHSYESNYGNLRVNYDFTSYNFAQMPDALTSESSQQEVNAVAKLMYECGVAVNMEYGSSESSAYDVEARAALINYYTFSPDLSFAERQYFSSIEWGEMLRTEIAAARPVYYSGSSEYGLGHAFICNGYNASGYFYFNFGWGGLTDGWYLNDAVMGYNSNQSAILGIVPNNSGNAILGQTKGNSSFIVDDPLEFYHLMGHNKYQCTNYSNSCSNQIVFVSAAHSGQLVADVLDFEDQNVNIYDGIGETNLVRSLSAGSDNDLSPVVSSDTAITLIYNGIFYNAGFKLQISKNTPCRMVSNIVASVDITTVHLTWTENGTATQWQVEYGVKGFALGEGIRQTLSTNTIDITNLQKFTEYDIYIRSICGEEQYGLWNKVTVMVEAPYWQDIVTAQPEGYVYNATLDAVEISSAEGFAWWAKNGCEYHAYLVNDIDLSGYKWRPTYSWHDLNGQGHIISNAYIKENLNDVGLFSDFSIDATISDLGIENFNVTGQGDRTGGLCGTLRGTLKNCYIKHSVVDGGDFTGGLVGDNSYGTAINCFGNVSVIGRRWMGLLIGSSNNGKEMNCYATGKFKQRSDCYIGGVVAYSSSGVVANCFSTNMPMGVVGYAGGTIISDTATFVKNDASCRLLRPIIFDEDSVRDLLTALNRYIEKINDERYCIWIPDSNNSNDGYPILGEKHRVLCQNVSDVSIQNIKNGEEHALSVGWQDNGEAVAWKIRYRRHDQPDSAYTYVVTDNNPTIIQGIPLGYVYDINVQAFCDENTKSGWSNTEYFIIDLIYWTDIVTSQPEGFVVDSEGNVTISSAEGLAWLAVKVNGLHGQEPDSYSGKTVTLTTDINLDGYRWKPIGGYLNYDWIGFEGTFDGQNHHISNIYVNDQWSNLGLFGYIHHARIKNVMMVGGNIASIFSQTSGESHATPSYAIGGLVGYSNNCYEISNCHSSVNVQGNGAGSLCGQINMVPNIDDYQPTNISNCSASGNIYGRESCGGLIGDVYGQVRVQNCFANGNVNTIPGDIGTWYRGGLIGNFMYASVENCYSTGQVRYEAYNSSYVGKVIGCPYISPHVRYIYADDGISTELRLIGSDCEDVSDTAHFHHDGKNNALLTSVSIKETAYDDLLNALNAWVAQQNSPSFKTWEIDDITGYPVFGAPYEPACYNPTELIVSQATIVGDTTIRTKLVWTQVGEPESWEIMYVARQHNLNEGVVLSTTTNPCILSDIPTGKPLDFYVRAICGGNDTSQWAGPITYLPDKLRWTEVVTTKPDGYYEDIDGNVFISTAEGLAWLSCVSNGLNGTQYEGGQLDNKNIILTSDINLNAYRWTPIAKDWKHLINGVVLNGNSHVITGLYCNEMADHQGLFGYLYNPLISNISINQCRIFGEDNVGAIAGYALGGSLTNCFVTGNIYGIESVGGIVGKAESVEITNSCVIGIVSSRTDIVKTNSQPYYNGGICGVPSRSSVINCYVVSDISDEFAYSGIITSSANSPAIVSHCYYKAYQTNLPITRDECIKVNNSSFDGSGYTWTLNTPPYINGAFYSDLVDALNAWVDANNSEGKYRRWVADTANVNGGFPIFYTAPKYEITFKNEDGTILQTSTLEEGEMPVAPEVPAKESTARYTYTFAGWDHAIAPATGNDTYIAVFTPQLRSYTITFLDEDGTVLESSVWDHGCLPSITTEPTKAATAQYTYTFAGWDRTIAIVTCDTSYTATYTATINKYLITFLNDDESILCAEEWEYGATPSCDEPTKEADVQYAYSFAGWQPEIVAVKGIATYTATYNALSNPTALPTNEQPTSPVKVIENGNIFILRDGKTYTVQGQEVR